MDDLFITCKRQETIDTIIGHPKTRHGGVKTSTGKRLQYLGMILDFTTERYVKVTMDGMIETTIAEHLGVEHSRTDTRKYRKSFNPKRSHKIAITFAASDSMNEVRRGVS